MLYIKPRLVDILLEILIYPCIRRAIDKSYVVLVRKHEASNPKNSCIEYLRFVFQS